MQRNIAMRFCLGLLIALCYCLPATAQLTINGADMVATGNAIIYVNGDFGNRGGDAEFYGYFETQGNLDNIQSAMLIFRDTLRVIGNISNEGTSGISFLTVEGPVYLSGNLSNTGNFNTNLGTLILEGGGNQSIQNNSPIYLEGLVLTGGGTSSYNSDVIIDSVLNLQFGILSMGLGDTLLLTGNATAEGGFIDSYVDGRIYHTGTGFKYFPIGKNGTFAPVWLEDVRGINPVVGIEMFEPNPGTPTAGFELLGIDTDRYWNLDVRSGQYDSSIVSVDLLGKDTTNLPITSNLKFITRTLAVAQSDSVSGTYNTLGNMMVQDDIITSERGLTQPFFAVALAPAVPEGGVLYIPSAMSPRSTNPEDQIFKVYGSKISSENFSLRIFNKWGLLVYETEDFNEANQVGWDGTHFSNGAEQPSGVYTYQVLGTFDSGREIEEVGTLTLIR